MTCRSRRPISRCPEALRWLALAILAALAGCAVKGYELGWRNEDPVAPLLGQPLDALSGCRYAEDAPAPWPACAGLVRAVGDLAAALPPVADAPLALGARCGEGVCSYANVYQRRDVGLALVLPIFRKVVLREAYLRLARGADGRWRLAALSVRDVPPPSYGPIRIGGDPNP